MTGFLYRSLDYKFDLMYSKRAFVHWYVGEGMEEVRVLLLLDIAVSDVLFRVSSPRPVRTLLLLRRTTRRSAWTPPTLRRRASTKQTEANGRFSVSFSVVPIERFKIPLVIYNPIFAIEYSQSRLCLV